MAQPILEERNERIPVCDLASIVSPYPSIYIEKEQAVIVSDIHLGIEASKAAKGIHIPYSLSEEVIGQVISSVRKTGSKFVYVLGDLKHEYGRPKEPVWVLLGKFVNEVRESNAEPIIIRGNHDNYIAPLLRKMQVQYHNSLYLARSRIFLTHGHQKSKLDKKFRPRLIVMGHEHPAVKLRDNLGISHVYKAFLFVPKKRSEESDLIALPSVNPLAYGSCVNDLAQDEFLSPYLRESSNLGKAKPFAIEVGGLVLPFPELSVLRRLG